MTVNTGPYMFFESVSVVVGGRTFWVNNDNDFCYRDRDTFGSGEKPI